MSSSSSNSTARLRKDQKEKVKQFISFTSTNEQAAVSCLTALNWNLEAACDNYYQNPTQYSAGNHAPESKRLSAFFAKYANDPKDRQAGVEGNKIGPNGMQSLLNDLNLRPTDRLVLALAWKLNASVQCEFTSKEFIDGMTKMGVDSVEKLRAQLPRLNEELKTPAVFQELYQFAYQYGKSVAQRSLGTDAAVAYWQLLFQGTIYEKRVAEWVNYLTMRKVRGVPRDTWNLFLEFLQTTEGGYDNYDSASAWPVLIDEFVDYVRTGKQMT